jgi:hypothetical protein
MRTSVLSLAVTVAACTPPVPPEPPPDPPTRFYSASAIMDQSDQVDESGSEHGALTPNAAQLVRPGVTVAFFPPNVCATTASEAGTGSTKEKSLIVMECGSLMSRLEAQSAKAGFQVVSWQGLRHRDKSPLEMARELQVDVLFEVNELSTATQEMGSSRATGMQFGSQTTPTNREALAVTPDVAGRCNDVVGPKLAAAAPKALLAVLDAKAVQVQTGRAIWYYKRSTHEALGREGRRELELYYPAPGKVDWSPPPRKHNGLQVGGAAMSGIGGLFVFMGGTLAGASLASGNEGLRRPGVGMLIPGLLVLAGGATMLAFGNRKAKKPLSVDYPPPVYDPPEDILCAYPPTLPPWKKAAQTGAETTPTAQTTYSFQKETSGGRDIERKRREALIRETADDFVAKLSELGAQ